MPTRRLLITALLLTLAALPQPASAQVAGEREGVTAVRGSHGYVLRFGKRAAKTYRRIAGRRVEVGCATVSPIPNGAGFQVDGASSVVATAPRRRGRIRTLTRGRADFCSVRLRGDELVAAAPITARGRTYLDELSTVALLDVPLELADEDGTPAPIAEVVAQAHGLVVALDGPDGTPPLRKAGYWTDGVRFVSAAVTSAGRRLFFDGERDVVRTNVLSYLTAG